MTIAMAVPVVITKFDELDEQVRRLLVRLSEGIDRVIDTARRSSRLLPNAAQVDALCVRLRDFWEQVRQGIKRVLEPVGKPWTVWETGAAWAEKFAGPLSAHLGEMNELHLSADYEWDGRAAEMYAAATSRQKEALAALQGIGNDLHTSLGHVAVAICALWAAVVSGLLVAAANLALAVASAVSGIGAPAAVAFLIETLAALASGVAVGIGGFMLVAERANDAMMTLQARLHDKSALDGGQWPAAKSERYRDGASWKLAEE
ncbi:hypothetical protein GCM10027280_21220 [Micromonospora polyrhachis]|uniref:Proteins of 100 residues with WXG n=1 Tax=Micromonospora polyrhachis TaxID=1282883 RepID=A0A7W7SXW7_9ACTN|nr:hypothetical protein [Micromonospora polyrhachis]MBB4961665.1 hypothetical protein [Micromonospora polyrhachis]